MAFCIGAQTQFPNLGTQNHGGVRQFAKDHTRSTDEVRLIILDNMEKEMFRNND